MDKKCFEINWPVQKLTHWLVSQPVCFLLASSLLPVNLLLIFFYNYYGGQVSIMNNINTSVGNTSIGEQEYTLYGKATITEILRGLAFEISANSFFQTNAHQVCIRLELKCFASRLVNSFCHSFYGLLLLGFLYLIVDNTLNGRGGNFGPLWINGSIWVIFCLSNVQVFENWLKLKQIERHSKCINLLNSCISRIRLSS